MILLTAVLAAAAPSPDPHPQVIVHADVAATSELSRREVRDLFLGRRTRWKGGVPVVPVMRPLSDPLSVAFCTKVLGWPCARVAAHWQREQLAGRAVRPPVKHQEAELIDAVASTPGAIAYVSSAALAELPSGIRHVPVVE